MRRLTSPTLCYSTRRDCRYCPHPGRGGNNVAGTSLKINGGVPLKGEAFDEVLRGFKAKEAAEDIIPIL